MGSTPSVPNVPSTQSVVQQQQNQNVGSQAASNYSLSDPYGNESFQQTGVDPTTGMPVYAINQNYSPLQQAIATGQQYGQLGAAQGASSLGSMMQSLYGIPANLASGSSSLTSQLENPIMSNLWNTTMQYQEPQLRTQLLNQGLTEDSPAYKQAMNNLTNQQASTFGQIGAQFQPQAFNEALTQEQLPLQNEGTLLGYAQPSSLPNSAGMGASAQPANVVGAQASTNQANMAAYNAQMAKASGAMSGMYGMGAAGITGLTSGGGASAIMSALPALALA